MKRCILLLATLLALPAFAQPLMTAAPLTPELTPERQLTQYRHDQINLLALRADAHSLLAAALLAGPDAADKSRPAALKPLALLKRAQEIGANDALVWWVTAANECRGKTKACPSTPTLQKLEGVDAQNGAVWALSLWRAQLAKDDVTARAALTSAAQAKRYNDYFGAIVAAIYQGQSILPMSSGLLNDTGQDASIDGYRLIMAANIAIVLEQPGYLAIYKFCKSANAKDAALVADCVAVAKMMASSGSMNVRHSAISLLESLLPAGPEKDSVGARARSLDWQIQQIGSLEGRLANDTRVTTVYTQALQESGNETDAVYAVLRSQGIALEPPAGWQPTQAAPSGP
jgi:hypothetical protein